MATVLQNALIHKMGLSPRGGGGVRRGLISGIIYSLTNGWVLIRGGGFNVGFYGIFASLLTAVNACSVF